MTEPQDEMPLGQLDAIDPYPFHGLVYSLPGETSIERIDPRDGRPAFIRPPSPGWNSDMPWHPYWPRLDASLWDIGRADPPVTPAIAASGAKAVGKRLVDRRDVGPARIGDKTYQVQIDIEGVGTPSPLEPDTHLQLSVRVRWPDADSQIFATLSHADLGVDFDTLYSQSGQTVSQDRGKYELTAREEACSADGTRRVYSVYLWELRSGPSSNLQSDSTPISFFEVILSGGPAGEVVATWQLLKNQAQCLGSFSETVTNNLQQRVVVSTGPCSFVYAMEPLPENYPNESIAGGTTTRRLTHNNVLLAAEYVDGQIVYTEADILRTAESSREQDGGGHSGTLENDTCVYPTIYIADHTNTVRTKETQRITLRMGAHSITQDYEFDAWSTILTQFQGDNADPKYITTTSGSTTITTAGRSWTSGPGSQTFAKAYAAQAPGATLVGVRHLFGFQLCAYPTPSSSGIAIREPLSSTPDVYVSPLLTPRGTVGALATESPGRLQMDGRPFYTASAYNPMTGEGARGVDMPGKQLIGYL